MELPVRFKDGGGLTRDVSRNGVYFVTSCSFEVGQPVRLSLSLPRVDPEPPVGLTYRGTVQRVEQLGTGRDGEENCGVAVAAQELGFSSGWS
jgi:hypothetical protein